MELFFEIITRFLYGLMPIRYKAEKNLYLPKHMTNYRNHYIIQVSFLSYNVSEKYAGFPRPQ